MEDGRANHPRNCRVGEIVLIKNKKTYLYDEKGVSLGAGWCDEWIDPGGRVVRKTRSSSKVLEEQR